MPLLGELGIRAAFLVHCWRTFQLPQAPACGHCSQRVSEFLKSAIFEVWYWRLLYRVFQKAEK